MQQRPKVVLFPTSEGYYREELRQLLEAERFGEAARLLQQLIEMRVGDEELLYEWQTLLDYLRMMVPDGRLPEMDDEEPDLSEDELLAAHVAARSEANGAFPDKLLALFDQPDQLERQVAALDQLRYLRHPLTAATLRGWLSRQALPPGIQFKTLQLLKLLGEEGTLTLRKQGQEYVVDIRETPAGPEDMPSAISQVPERVADQAALLHPELTPFVAETWQDFIAFAYGTPVFVHLLRADEEQTDLWAAALHLTLLKAVHGFADANEIAELYGVTEDMKPGWRQASDALRAFLLTAWPERSD